jgi:hypothetical protein
MRRWNLPASHRAPRPQIRLRSRARSGGWSPSCSPTWWDRPPSRNRSTRRRCNEEGAAWAERALVAAGPVRLIEVIAEALDTRGVCIQGLGRLDEGIALLRASVELAAAHHLSAAELRARFDLAGRMYGDDPGGSSRSFALASMLRDALAGAIGWGRSRISSSMPSASSVPTIQKRQRSQKKRGRSTSEPARRPTWSVWRRHSRVPTGCHQTAGSPTPFPASRAARPSARRRPGVPRATGAPASHAPARPRWCPGGHRRRARRPPADART